MTHARSLAAALVLALLGLIILVATGCAHSPTDKARQYGTGLADGGLAAGKFLASLNEQKEAEIMSQLEIDGDAAKARHAREAWRRIYDGCDKALKVFGAGVSGLRASIELAAAGKTLNLAKVMAEGLKLWTDLQAALNSFGVKVPGLGGV